MDFRLDEAQLELQDTVRRWCENRLAHEDLARREDGSVDRDGWRALAELGVFAVLLPESAGGSGIGIAGGAIVFEQLGAHLFLGPVLWTALAAPWVDGAARGERLVGGIEPSSAPDEPILVEHGAEIDALVVLREEGVFVCTGGELPSFEPVAPLDPLTPVGRFGDSDTHALALGAAIEDGAA
jgi:alkylation response protein AidB-like acyl-CoA dehydrogenase